MHKNMAKKILIVEDNPENRILLKDVLTCYGYDVIEAGDGQEGVRKAKEEKPVLVFIDLRMPIMDGYAVVEMLRQDPQTKGIKMIAVTAYAMKGDKEKAVQAGFDEYITKPIDINTLPGLLKKHMEG